MELIALTYTNARGRVVTPGEIFEADEAQAAWMMSKGAAKAAAPAPIQVTMDEAAEENAVDIAAEDAIKPARKSTRKKKGATE